MEETGSFHVELGVLGSVHRLLNFWNVPLEITHVPLLNVAVASLGLHMACQVFCVPPSPVEQLRSSPPPTHTLLAPLWLSRHSASHQPISSVLFREISSQ